MKLGIVGLPNVGKSTLFNAITMAGAECANYPFCTIEPNVGVVSVPDERLTVLTRMYSSKKTTPAFCEFVDIAGLVKGASTGEGLGNKFLSHIREVDAIVHVVRCFIDDNIVHVHGGIDPLSDVETINLELIFSDIDAIDRRLERLSRYLKTNDKRYIQEAELLSDVKKELTQGKQCRELKLTSDQLELLSNVNLLTQKPVLYVANVAEEHTANPLDNPEYGKLHSYAAEHDCGSLAVSAKIEAEIATLSDSEKQMFLSDMGVSKSGLDRLIESGYQLLGLISYLTAGEQETRAWTITKGTKAPGAAGKIHTDFERGFIRAEVIPYQELVECGSIAKAKEKGLVRSEGKEYIVQDGDVILFRFNV